MNNRCLLIITFSYLKSNGGGVESWLQKFLKNIDFLGNTYKIHEIIGLNDGTESFVKNISNKTIIFNLVDVKQHSSLIILPSFIKRVLKVIKKHENELLDVVFIGSNYASIPIIFLKKNNHINKFIWLRSFFPKEIYSTGMARFRKIFLRIEHKALKSANLLIANGIDTKALYEDYYSDLPEIITIPNGIDRRLVKQNSKALCDKTIKIAFVSRLETIKGFDIFCESIRITNEDNKNNNFEFYIVGDGKLADLARLTSEKYNNVFYKGIMSNSDVYSFLSTIDCSVLLGRFSEKEGGSGLSNSLLESIFSRNLIIANDSFGYRQTLDDSSAIFVKEGDAKALSDIYITIEKDRESNISRINKAIELNKDYDFEHHMQKFLDLVKR